MMSRSSVAVAVLMLVLYMSSRAAETSVPGTTPKPVPLIDVTDLYHPHQDVGDNFDILAATMKQTHPLKRALIFVAPATLAYRRSGNAPQVYKECPP